MNKTILFLCLLSFSLLLLVSEENNMLTGYSTIQDEKLKLGYCPTMTEDAELIKGMNPKIELIEYTSSSTVLASLNSKDIDIALIGRKTKTYELDDGFERMLKKGHTLIAPSKEFIYYNDLIKLKIYTAIDRDITEKKYPYLYFEFLENEDILFDGKNIILISWDDFKNDMELLIPLNPDGSKIKEFRTPILYSMNPDLLKGVKYE